MVNKEATEFKDLIKAPDSGMRVGSCVYNAIITKYRTAIEKSGRCKNWLKKHQVSYEGLIPNRSGGELTISEIIDEFFRPLNLALICIDIHGTIIKECCYNPMMDGKTISKNIFPNTTALIIHEEHAFLCNRKLEELFHTFLYNEEVGNYVSIYKNKALIEGYAHYPKAFELSTDIAEIKCLDDVCKTKCEHLVYCGDLMDIALDLKKMGHCFPVSYDGNQLRAVKLNVGESKVDIRNYVESDEPFEVNANLIQLKNNLSKEYICEKYKSKYDQDTKNALKELAPIASNGGFIAGTFETIGIDMKKHYSKQFYNIDKIPVLTSFDRFTFDIEDILENDFVLVERIGDINLEVLWTYRPKTIMMGSDYHKYSMYVTPLMKLRPSKWVKHDKKVIEEIFESENVDSDKKDAVNQLIGLLGKTRNVGGEGWFFTDEDEASIFDRRDSAVCLEFCCPSLLSSTHGVGAISNRPAFG